MNTNPLNDGFGKNRCFLCNEKFSGGSGPRSQTQEHLLPQWLFKRFGLSRGREGEKLFMNCSFASDPEVLSYSQTPVPCCQECNNFHLNNIETAVSNGLATGQLQAIRDDALMLWLGKIYFGLACRGTLWKIYSDKKGRSLLSSDELRTLDELRFLLQKIRGPLIVSAPPDDVLWSIFLFPLDTPTSYFNLRGSLNQKFMSICLGNIGIACVFDGGQLHRHSKFRDLENIGSLSVGEFAEVSAWLCAAQSLIQWVPKLDFDCAKGMVTATFSGDGLDVFQEPTEQTISLFNECLMFLLPKSESLPASSFSSDKKAVGSFLYDRWPWKPFDFAT